MKQCTILILCLGLVSSFAESSDLSEKARRFILSFATDNGGGGDSGCSDQQGNCDAYGSSVCSNSMYTQWVKDNCKKFCNLCSGGGGSPSYPQPEPIHSISCSDKLSNCNQYDSSACQNYAQWARDNCARTCNLCSGGSSSGGSTGGGSTSGGSSGGGSGSMTGTSSGCVYNNKVYQQGQTWKDNCKYRCECVDGSTGKYQCTALCLTWNLPPACHMNPAAQGKCCPTPDCPSYITLQYPPGYVAE